MRPLTQGQEVSYRTMQAGVTRISLTQIFVRVKQSISANKVTHDKTRRMGIRAHQVLTLPENFVFIL